MGEGAQKSFAVIPVDCSDQRGRTDQLQASLLLNSANKVLTCASALMGTLWTGVSPPGANSNKVTIQKVAT